jgi:hypothetical protein
MGVLKFLIKQSLIEFVTHQLDSSKCVKEVNQIICCSRLYNKDLDWSIKDLVRNIYFHYDRMYNMNLAEESGMKYFVFLGGVIGDSRDFCVAHNNKVWSTDEARTWRNWIPIYG